MIMKKIKTVKLMKKKKKKRMKKKITEIINKWI